MFDIKALCCHGVGIRATQEGKKKIIGKKGDASVFMLTRVCGFS